jgi:hypothetical protein
MSDINTRELRRLIREALLAEKEQPKAASAAVISKTMRSQDALKMISTFSTYERTIFFQMLTQAMNAMAADGNQIDGNVISKFKLALDTLKANADKVAKQPVKEERKAMMDDEGKIHDDTHEVDMAESQLYRLAQYAPEVYGMVDNYADLPGWVQKKITLATDYIGSVKHYLEHEHFKAKNHLGENEDGNDL